MALRAGYALLILGAGWGAYGLRFDLEIPPWARFDLAAVVTTLLVAKMLCFELFRLQRIPWSCFGMPDAWAVGAANSSGSLLAFLVLPAPAAGRVPASIWLIDWLLSTVLLLTASCAVRTYWERACRRPRRGCKRVFIYGAGHTGLALLREIRSNAKLPYEVVGFIDDDPDKLHTSVQAVPVLGPGAELPRLAELHAIDQILVAAPSASAAERARLRELAGYSRRPCGFMPSLSEVVLGTAAAGSGLDEGQLVQQQIEE